MKLNVTPVILLAAGNSSRLGRPKQLLSFNGRTLLEHALAVANEIAGKQTVLVLGANSEEISGKLPAGDYTIALNPDWQEGIASSIRCGLAAVLSDETVTQVILVVSDQPYLSRGHLSRLIATAETSKNAIIASAYKQTTGTPVLFKKDYFYDLLNLQGDNGAKKLLVAFAADVALVPFEEGAVDIDTQEDYEKLQHDHRQV